MRTLIACLLISLNAFPLAAQQPAAASLPGKAHAALALFAGDWDAQAKFWMWTDPSAPPMEATATVRAEMIMDGRFLLQKVQGQSMGKPLDAIGVIGYNNATARYEAASFDNMGTSISRHVGEANDAGDIVLHLRYQDQATGDTIDRRTVKALVSTREWIETAHETRNGVERKVMEIRARRIR